MRCSRCSKLTALITIPEIHYITQSACFANCMYGRRTATTEMLFVVEMPAVQTVEHGAADPTNHPGCLYCSRCRKWRLAATFETHVAAHNVAADTSNTHRHKYHPALYGQHAVCICVTCMEIQFTDGFPGVRETVGNKRPRNQTTTTTCRDGFHECKVTVDEKKHIMLCTCVLCGTMKLLRVLQETNPVYTSPVVEHIRTLVNGWTMNHPDETIPEWATEFIGRPPVGENVEIHYSDPIPLTMDKAHETCTICMEQFSSPEEPATTMPLVHTLDPCQHLFHAECFAEYVRRRFTTCPCCREPFLGVTYHEINETEPNGA